MVVVALTASPVPFNAPGAVANVKEPADAAELNSPTMTAANPRFLSLITTASDYCHVRYFKPRMWPLQLEQSHCHPKSVNS
jgi:hypothetical protein